MDESLRFLIISMLVFSTYPIIFFSLSLFFRKKLYLRKNDLTHYKLLLFFSFIPVFNLFTFQAALILSFLDFNFINIIKNNISKKKKFGVKTSKELKEICLVENNLCILSKKKIPLPLKNNYEIFFKTSRELLHLKNNENAAYFHFSVENRYSIYERFLKDSLSVLDLKLKDEETKKINKLLENINKQLEEFIISFKENKLSIKKSQEKFVLSKETIAEYQKLKNDFKNSYTNSSETKYLIEKNQSILIKLDFLIANNSISEENLLENIAKIKNDLSTITQNIKNELETKERIIFEKVISKY